jgi:hypothetical protein
MLYFRGLDVTCSGMTYTPSCLKMGKMVRKFIKHEAVFLSERTLNAERLEHFSSG